MGTSPTMLRTPTTSRPAARLVLAMLTSRSSMMTVRNTTATPVSDAPACGEALAWATDPTETAMATTSELVTAMALDTVAMATVTPTVPTVDPAVTPPATRETPRLTVARTTRTTRTDTEADGEQPALISRIHPSECAELRVSITENPLVQYFDRLSLC